VYGHKEKIWIGVHREAGAILVTEDTDNIQIISPRVQLWDQPRDCRYVRRITSQIQRAMGKIIVVRAPRSASLLEPSDDEIGEEEATTAPLPSGLGSMGDFLIGQYGPHTLVEVQVPDIYREPDEAASNTCRPDVMGNITAMTVLEFVECAHDTASGGLRFLAGRNSVPSRPAEWWRE